MSTESHPWASAANHFKKVVLPKLQSYGKRIGEDATAGNEIARRIIAHYGLLRRSFDPMTALFVERDFDLWFAENAKKPLNEA